MLDRSNPYHSSINPMLKHRVLIYKELKTKTITTGEDWSKFSKIKQAYRDSYSTEQKGLCAYCRTDIEYDGKHEDLEHIIHKNHKPLWMLRAENIVLSCKICNTSKGVKHSLKAAYRNDINFRYNSDSYRMIHPQLDNYQNHIVELDTFFIRTITSKGRMTALICDLWRPNLAIKKAKKYKINNHGLAGKAIFNMNDKTLPKWERRSLRKLILEVIDKRPLD